MRSQAGAWERVEPGAVQLSFTDAVEWFVIDNLTGVVQVEGASGVYYVMTEEAMRIRQYVLEGLEQAGWSDIFLWDMEGIINKASRIKEQHSS